MSRIELKNINKYFGNNHVLKDINFVIEDGDFMTLLGPSGCGKTTTLRVITGLENPEEGIVTIGGKEVVNGQNRYYASPASRNLNLVFQSYALWPHMTVYDNVAFGLTIKKVPKKEIRARVEAALDKLQILPYIDRYPSELSGGQQQRVSIARAIVTEPKILLLDEPLSNLDAKLRLEMRAELKRLHSELDTTIIYVTHDQVEALTLSTKIAVFFEGELAQLDKPRNIYREPADLRVADFVGNPQINLIEGIATYRDGHLVTESSLGKLAIPFNHVHSGDIVISAYPEDIQIHTEKVDEAVGCKVYSVLPAGSETLVQLALNDNTIILAKYMGERDFIIGSEVWISFSSNKLNVYDKETGVLLSKEVESEEAKVLHA